MKFIGVKETAKTTKQLKGQAGGPRVEIRYSVNNEEVEVYGSWYMTDNEFGEWKEAWKHAGTTRLPMSQKAIKELVLRAIEIEQNEDK